MPNSFPFYRAAVALALVTPLMLLWLIGAVGVLGVAGDRADLMYLGVIGVGVIGVLVARGRPRGMARALVAMALAQAVVTVIALIMGMHTAPYSSVGEVLGLNGFFVAMFLLSAWLFRQAAKVTARA